MEQEHWWFKARTRIIRELAIRLLGRHATVIDVGCGTGGVLSALPASWTRIGVDPSEPAIEAARRLHPRIDFRVGTAPASVVDDLAGADLVMFCDVLEHIEDDVDVLARVVVELQTGARVLITVPAHMKLWSPHDVTHGHYRRYERTTLPELWNGLPVNSSLVCPLNWHLYPIVRAVRAVARLTGRSVGDDQTDLFLPPRPVNSLLHRIFASEAPSVLDALQGQNVQWSRSGVSWLVVLERSPASSASTSVESTRR